MTQKLHKFVQPFTLYINVENAPNPVRKQFENTNIHSEAYSIAEFDVECDHTISSELC